MSAIRLEPARVGTLTAREGEGRWYGFDLQLAIFALSLTVVGLLMAFTNSADDPFRPGSIFMRSLIWLALAAVIFVATAAADHHWLRTFAWPIYGFSIALLVLTLAVGSGIGGVQRWVSIFGLQFQFSEVAKILVVDREPDRALPEVLFERLDQFDQGQRVCAQILGEPRVQSDHVRVTTLPGCCARIDFRNVPRRPAKREDAFPCCQPTSVQGYPIHGRETPSTGLGVHFTVRPFAARWCSEVPRNALLRNYHRGLAVPGCPEGIRIGVLG